MIHSGVWGFASSPIVTEDEIRRITRMATEVAKASAIAKKTDVKLAPVPAYQDYWATPIDEGSRRRSRTTTSRRSCRRSSTPSSRTRTCTSVNVSVQLSYEWKYFASSEGSYIEQEICHDDAELHRDGAQGRRSRGRAPSRGVPEDRRLGSRRSGGDARERRADRRRSGRVLHRQAGRHGRQGSRSSRRRTRC